jgi:phenylacetate-CoA ligase
MERATAEEITRYQERRLRALVRVAAARSPFYRDWFAGSGIDPASIRTLDDLTKLPLLHRNDLMVGPDRFLVYPRQLMWPAHSSGTSGAVITTHRTPGSSAYELSALERQWSWFGVPAQPRRILLRGADPDTDSTGALTRVIPGARQMVVSSYRLGLVDLSRLLEEMRAFRPQAVEGWPSSIALLASLLRDRHERLPVSGIITSSEVMTAGQVELMRDAFCGPVIDHYGQTERVTMAGSCEAGNYHVFPDYGITELIPVEGRTDRWEIVGTPLHNWGFPLFRYRTGDEVGPVSQDPCPCGRAFARLGTIDGRLEDSFTAADGRVLPMASIVTGDLVGLREVQVAQLAPGHFEFRLVPAPGTDIARIQQQALHNVHHYFGPDQTVTFRILDRVPRSPSGKLKSAIVVGTTRSAPSPETS